MPEAPDALEALDEIYFAKESWETRLSGWVDALKRERGREFLEANTAIVGFSATRGELSLNMVANLSATTLVRFLNEGKYKNCYDLEAECGDTGRHKVDERRRRVDEAVFPKKDSQSPDEYKKWLENHYYGAVALTGWGIRS